MLVKIVIFSMDHTSVVYQIVCILSDKAIGELKKNLQIPKLQKFQKV